MKTLLRMLVLLVCAARLHAASLSLEGDLTFNITEPRATFALDGKLVNKGPQTGTLRLLLRASPRPFPAAGHLVAQQTLSALPPGYQFTDFSLKSKSSIPYVSGKYYFTILVTEYTRNGWRNVMAIPSGTRTLVGGNLLGQKKWFASTKAVNPPFKKLNAGDLLRVTLKASGESNLFPNALQSKTSVTVKSNTRLETKTGSKKTAAVFTYATKTEKFNGKNVPTGRLFIDYAKAAKSKTPSNVTLSLYFQGQKTGTYKSVDVGPAGKETTWGTFTSSEPGLK